MGPNGYLNEAFILEDSLTRLVGNNESSKNDRYLLVGYPRIHQDLLNNYYKLLYCIFA